MGKWRWVPLIVLVMLLSGAPSAQAVEAPVFSGGALVAPYAGNQQPSVAYNGSKSLVVWSKTVAGQTDIWGRTTSPDTTTTGGAFPIATGTTPQHSPDVAWNGSNWLVVWQTVAVEGRGAVRGRRVAASGALVGAELSLTTGSNASRPAVAVGPNGQSMVVWADARNASRANTSLDVYGGRVTSTGARLDGNGVRLSRDTVASPTYDEDPDVAWNGSSYLVVWREAGVQRSQIVATQRRANGTAITGGALTPTTVLAGEPAVASNGKDFMVVADWSSAAAPNDIRGIRVTAAFAKTSFPVSTASGNQGSPAIAFNDSYLATWVDSRNGAEDLWAGRISAAGAVLDPQGVLFTEYHPVNRDPALARGAGAGTWTLAWSPQPDGQGPGVVAYGVRFALA